jgi:hypothetical protein
VFPKLQDFLFSLPEEAFMRRNNQSALALLSLACVVLLAACSSSTPVLQYVTITPSTGTTSVGGTLNFTAQAYYSNGSVQDGTSLVTWASSNASVATIVAGGLATGAGAGTTSITATAVGTPGASATLTVNKLTSIAVTPANPTVPRGTNQQFTATATFSDGTTGNITSTSTWTSSNPAAATMDATTIGQADVPATATVGATSTITATQFGVSGSTVLTTPGVSVSVSPQATAVGTGQTVSFTANVTNGKSGVTWTASEGTVDVNGNFVAPAGPQSTTVTVTATSKDDTTKSASATVNVVAPGQVTATGNEQVAQYTVAPAAAGNVFVQFGQDMNYGLTTWTQPVPSGGGPVSLFVAGMKANTPYHMRGVVAFSDGTQFMDADQTFTTGAIPAVELPIITVTTTAGQTPQSGVELLDLINTVTVARKVVAVTDLAGNMLWGYNPALVAGTGANGVKLLPNGHFLINFSGQNPDGINSLIEEVDLGNNVIWQMTAAQLNQALAAATCAGCNITVIGTHHDFAILPNGHLIVIAAQNQIESGVTVTGDVLIDLDQNHNPVWVWSTFDHLDVTRQPFGTDWTHTNSVAYSPDDKALIVSMRNQSWVIKIDYGDGQGTGKILWKLGKDGDFTLMNGTDPVDWFYAQHDANVVSTNSSGTFQLMLFDNGDNRVLDSSGTICGTTTPCVSRVPVLQLDELGHTATIEWVDALAPVFSFFGGSSRLLANGNIEFDECAPTFPTGNAAIFEVTKATMPQTVWQMQITGQFAYRGVRIPSLYPGVQW